MSFPKHSARELRDKYPLADAVIQVRIANREGDTISYEGVCPIELKDRILMDLFTQSMSEVKP